MTSTPNITVDRKALAKELAQETGAEVKYLGVPSCAYKVGPYTINKDASISGDDLEAIRDFLIRHDYIHQEPATPIEEDAAVDSEVGAHLSEPIEDDTEITETNVSIPISELTATTLVNLLKLVHAKQKLISAMTQSEFIFIDEEVIDLLNDEKPDSVEQLLEIMRSESRVNMIRGLDLKEDLLTFSFPFDSFEPTRWVSYTKLFLALIDRAKTAQHINAKRIEPAESEMKYYCNSLLMQLGFGGADLKADRAVLLGHLPGYAAFKSNEKMEAHKARFSERRKAAKRTAEEDSSDQAAGDLKTDSEGVSE